MSEPVVLPGIEVTPGTVAQAVSATLHTVLFCRLLGALSPVDAAADQFGLTYATVGDPAVLAAVASKAASVAAWAETHRGQRAAVRLSLFEGGSKAEGSAGAPPRAWETWVLPLAVSPPPATSSSLAGGETQALGTSPAAPNPLPSPPLGRGRPGLEAVLLAAAAAAAARREGVPPVLTPAVATFPFAIDLVPVPLPAAQPGGGGGGGGLSSPSTSFGLGAVKRLLLQASPPSVLS